MALRTADRLLPPLTAIVGAATFAVASVVTALAYTGTAGEAYSPFNHWVSELGQVGVSKLALLFNIGLIVAGWCFALFMVGFSHARRGALAWIYGAIGSIAGVAGAFVGYFPMNDLERHSFAALIFFALGVIAVGLASIDFIRRPDPRFPRWLARIGAATVVLFIGFLAVTYPLLGADGLGAPEVREGVWMVAVLEWAVLMAILAWVFATGWTWWRARNAHVD